MTPRRPNPTRDTIPAMTDTLDHTLTEIETHAESALMMLEGMGRWEEALEVARMAGASVDELTIDRKTQRDLFKVAKRLRAYLYLREANALRALGRPAEVADLGEKELQAAMLSGHGLTIARAMISLGSTKLANGDLDNGTRLLNEAKPMLEHHDEPDHKQALGWWYILQADIRNSGLLADTPEAALALAEHGLALVRPLKNWAGIARAHQARAKALTKLGRAAEATQANQLADMALDIGRAQQH